MKKKKNKFANRVIAHGTGWSITLTPDDDSIESIPVTKEDLGIRRCDEEGYQLLENQDST